MIISLFSSPNFLFGKCGAGEQAGDNLIVKDCCFIIEIFDEFRFSVILRGFLSHLNKA